MSLKAETPWSLAGPCSCLGRTQLWAVVLFFEKDHGLGPPGCPSFGLPNNEGIYPQGSLAQQCRHIPTRVTGPTIKAYTRKGQWPLRFPCFVTFGIPLQDQHSQLWCPWLGKHYTVLDYTRFESSLS